MAALSSRPVALAGTAVTLVAASAGGDTMDVGSNNFLHVKTAGTGATVTVASVVSCNQGSTHNLVVVVGATAEVLIGPINAQYASATTGLAAITYSQVVTVTVEALRI